jgi:hypothetical protein
MAPAPLLSCGLLLELFGSLLRVSNLNLARPHCIWDLTKKIDREQTVYEIGVCHLDGVSQVEPTLECPAGDAMVEIELLLAGILAARDGQHVLLRHDRQFVWTETGDRKFDPVRCLAGLYDIVWWIPLVALRRSEGAIQKVEHTVKPNGRPAQGSKIVVPHGHILLQATWIHETPDTQSGAHFGPFTAPTVA